MKLLTGGKGGIGDNRTLRGRVAYVAPMHIGDNGGRDIRKKKDGIRKKRR